MTHYRFKTQIKLLMLIGFFVGLGIILPAREALAAKEICFCHDHSSLTNPFETICTSNEGLQEGHIGHGDIQFGCYCGDGTCDPNDGETEFTCPQDCGTAPNCGNGQDNGWEDCGEPGLPVCDVTFTCTGCRCVPPPPECFYNQDCPQLDADICNGSEVCGPGHICASTPPLSCDNSDACDGVETCNPSTGCQAGTPVVCDDQQACSTDTCDPLTGQCQFDNSSCSCTTAQDCDDGNVCNGAEDCDLVTGCLAGTPLTCDNGNACDGVESCNPSTGCQSGTPVVCDDQQTCSADSCDPQTGQCQFDLSACTCTTALDCDDGNPCTDDTCDSSSNECSNVSNASLPGCAPVPAVNPENPGTSGNSMWFEGSGCSLSAMAHFTPSIYGILLFTLGSLGLLRLQRKN